MKQVQFNENRLFKQPRIFNSLGLDEISEPWYST